MIEWRYAKLLKIGVSHIKSNTECQDRVKIAENEKMLAAALSDGVGSCEYSADAAEITTSTACRFFEALDVRAYANTQAIVASLLLEIQRNVKEYAVSTNKPLESLHCTFVFAYINKERNRAIVGRLGDSGVCIIKKSGSFTLVDNGASANMTHSVMFPNPLSLIDISEYDLNDKDIQGFILCSDGLDGIVYTKGESLVNKAAESYFNAALSSAPDRLLEGNVRALTEHEDTPYDDDISIAVISRAKSNMVFPDDPNWLCSCGQRNALTESYCTKCDADFIEIFSKIDFEKHGGKSAFFLKANKNLEFERQIVGIPAKEGQNTNGSPKPAPVRPTGNMPAQRQKTNKEEKKMTVKKKSNSNALVSIIVLAAVLLLLVLNFVLIAILSSELDSVKKQLEELKGESFVSEEISDAVSDGSYTSKADETASDDDKSKDEASKAEESKDEESKGEESKSEDASKTEDGSVDSGKEESKADGEASDKNEASE